MGSSWPIFSQRTVFPSVADKDSQSSQAYWKPQSRHETGLLSYGGVPSAGGAAAELAHVEPAKWTARPLRVTALGETKEKLQENTGTDL